MNKPSVRVEIDIHQAIKAVEFFATNHPADRLDDYTANRLRRAAELITRRVGEQRYLDLLAKFKVDTDKVLARIYPVDNDATGYEESNAHGRLDPRENLRDGCY